jgi:hypothetical protein
VTYTARIRALKQCLDRADFQLLNLTILFVWGMCVMDGLTPNGVLMNF